MSGSHPVFPSPEKHTDLPREESSSTRYASRIQDSRSERCTDPEVSLNEKRIPSLPRYILQIRSVRNRQTKTGTKSPSEYLNQAVIIFTFATKIAISDAAIAGREVAPAMNVAPATPSLMPSASVRTYREEQCFSRPISGIILRHLPSDWTICEETACASNERVLTSMAGMK